jgi:prepilin-type processing-associated H-X9-DG protein
MFGYPPDSLYGSKLTVEFAGHTFNPPISRRYPWRLLPYVSDVWDIIHNHTDTPRIPSPNDPEGVAFKDAYELSVYPSYGMNDIFVGGNAGYGGYAELTPKHYEPVYGKYIIFHNSEVRRPSNLIVLGESQFNLGYEPQQGFLHLTPHYAGGEQWRLEGNDFVALVQTPVGFPKGRYGPAAGMGFFDGHVEGKTPTELQDMRYWANNATTEDYDFVP